MAAQRRLDLVLDSVKRLLRIGATANLLNLLQKQHPADLAQIFSELPDKDREAAFSLLADSPAWFRGPFFIAVTAFLFGYFMVITQLPMTVAAWVKGLSVPPWVVIMILVGVYVVLGCFLDSLSMIVVTVPVFLPLIQALGYDPVWFGIVTDPKPTIVPYRRVVPLDISEMMFGIAGTPGCPWFRAAYSTAGQCSPSEMKTTARSGEPESRTSCRMRPSCRLR